MNLSAIKRRLQNASPGPWYAEYQKGGKTRNTFIGTKHALLWDKSSDIICPVNTIATVWNVSCTCIQGHQYENQEFIAHARQDVEDLLNEVIRLRKFLSDKSPQKGEGKSLNAPNPEGGNPTTAGTGKPND